MVVTTPFERAAAALAAYDRNARDAMSWVHPSWLAEALGADATAIVALRTALLSCQRERMDAASCALLHAAGVEPPGIARFIAPGITMLDALPIEHGLRMLRVRALLFRGAQVRRLIDKVSRRRLVEWTGVPLDAITDAATGAPDVAALALSDAMKPLDEIDAQKLAEEGYLLIVRDEADADRAGTPCTLLRLALPFSVNLPGWFRTRAGGLDQDGTLKLLAHLPVWLPEWKWLFG
ncbi:type III secretion protein HrpB4 [Mycetohabitans endofungorum]|uniref:type III secretion protein HrpB4 n=1 Tax=Mycetohabitans endofungorum TaxID=417203 RepID=UPI002B056D1B|nr:type III secretion protein HrpB4 [Mycetohabitans endofungorum]